MVVGVWLLSSQPVLLFVYDLIVGYDMGFFAALPGRHLRYTDYSIFIAMAV
jgi:hypothetical protein